MIHIGRLKGDCLRHWRKTPAITCTTYQVHHQHQQFFLLNSLKTLQVALFKGIEKKETWETSWITETVIAVQLICYECFRSLCQLASCLNLNCTATLEANWELGVRPEGSSWLFIMLCLPIAVAQWWTVRSPNSGCCVGLLTGDPWMPIPGGPISPGAPCTPGNPLSPCERYKAFHHNSSENENYHIIF